MSNQTLLDFEQECKELGDNIGKTEDYDKLKKSCNGLFETLRIIAPQLSPYDRERYYAKVDSLLKRTCTKESSTGEGGKKFRFQKKISLKKPASHVVKPFQTVRSTTATRSGELITLKGSTASYENLNKCTLVTENTPFGQNGSLILYNVNNSLVTLDPTPFATGSIFITDCDNLTISFTTPPQNAVQVRLRNLSNCRLLVRPDDSASEQVVVLEHCTNCIFHKATEHQMKLQNFSALRLTGADHNSGYEHTKDYRFEPFDLAGYAHR